MATDQAVTRGIHTQASCIEHTGQGGPDREEGMVNAGWREDLARRPWADTKTIRERVHSAQRPPGRATQIQYASWDVSIPVFRTNICIAERSTDAGGRRWW